MPTKPKYAHHKATGQARVIIDGKHHYLGAFGSPESKERYDELVEAWLSKQDIDGITLTVDELAILFVNHAKEYYRKPDGTPTTEVTSIQHALKLVIEHCGRIRARDFGPKALKAVRKKMIDAGYVRTNINRMIFRIRRMFSWGVEEELIPVTVYQALKAVPSLKRGRSAARESQPVRPVDQGSVDSTLPHLPRVVADMVRLQLLTGARPGELCSMRACDITLSTTGVWTYRPASHKTAHRGKERRIFIGPQGQEILRRYLDRDPERHCFSPADSEADRNEQRKRNRKSKVTPSQAARKQAKKRSRPPKDNYTKDSYARAIRRVCEAQEIDVWSPNQLRHSRATIIREKYGLEAAQVVLGHAEVETTQIYAERDFAAAARIMSEIG